MGGRCERAGEWLKRGSVVERASLRQLTAGLDACPAIVSHTSKSSFPLLLTSCWVVRCSKEWVSLF